MEYLKLFDFYEPNINFNTNKSVIRGGVCLFCISAITVYYLYNFIHTSLYPKLEYQFNLEYLSTSHYNIFEKTSILNLNFTISLT